MMMNVEVKGKWVAALRSKKYEQGKRYLNRGNKFCCLGVFCDVLDPLGWYDMGEVVPDEYEGVPPQGHRLGTTGLTLDICTQVYNRMDRNHVAHVTRMNDEGKSFEEIADYIEANF